MMAGSTIRHLRKQSGMTQGDLAQRIGRCPATVSFYERNMRDIPTSVLVKIARIFQVPPGALFAFEEQGDAHQS